MITKDPILFLYNDGSQIMLPTYSSILFSSFVFTVP